MSDKELGTNPKDLLGVKKAPINLVPASSIIYQALAMGNGAKKYGPYNWRENKVIASIYVAAAMRHLMAWHDSREELAEDSGVPHLGHALSCLGILVDAYETGNLKDDRPTVGATSELLAKWEQKEEELVEPDLNLSKACNLFGEYIPEYEDKVKVHGTSYHGESGKVVEIDRKQRTARLELSGGKKWWFNWKDLERTPYYSRPTVGDKVKIIGHDMNIEDSHGYWGKVGFIISDDKSLVPYEIEFEDLTTTWRREVNVERIV